MRLDLYREPSDRWCTMGQLFVNGHYECETLEDVVRAVKVQAVTAIPAGTYDIDVTYSTRFKRDLPLIKNVPQFTGVRIHAGNTAADTEGCILVGTVRGPERVLSSRQAFALLFDKIDGAYSDKEKITLTIHAAGSKFVNKQYHELSAA